MACKKTESFAYCRNYVIIRCLLSSYDLRLWLRAALRASILTHALLQISSYSNKLEMIFCYSVPIEIDAAFIRWQDFDSVYQTKACLKAWLTEKNYNVLLYSHSTLLKIWVLMLNSRLDSAPATRRWINTTNPLQCCFTFINAITKCRFQEKAQGQVAVFFIAANSITD